MRSSVNVPVLSEQMVVTDPRVSTAGSLRMRAFRRIMRCAPRARQMVTMAGNPSGTAATARATAMMNISSTAPPSSKPSTKTRPTRTKQAMASHLPSSAILRWSGVLSSDTCCNMPAMLPNCVLMPVSTTTAAPRP